MSAKFPVQIWDGSSGTRTPAIDLEPVTAVQRPPDAVDWSQIVAEVVAVQNALATTTAIAGAGNTVALATTATSGFAYIPKVAGTSTGVPANVPAGYVAWVWDTTNKKIGVYDSGWKYTVALS